MAQPLEIILITNDKLRNMSWSNKSEISRQHSLLKNCSCRNSIVCWLYQAQEMLNFSRSTLYLSFSILDRLILADFEIEDYSTNLLGGTILLICSKFNEIYPVQIKTIILKLSAGCGLKRNEFVSMEGVVLEKLKYNIVQQNNFYQNIAQLQNKYANLDKQKIQELIQMSILNPNVFRYGIKVLTAVLEHLYLETVIELEYDFEGEFIQIKEEIQLSIKQEQFNTTQDSV